LVEFLYFQACAIEHVFFKVSASRTQRCRKTRSLSDVDHTPPCGSARREREEIHGEVEIIAADLRSRNEHVHTAVVWESDTTITRAVMPFGTALLGPTEVTALSSAVTCFDSSLRRLLRPPALLCRHR